MPPAERNDAAGPLFACPLCRHVDVQLASSSFCDRFCYEAGAGQHAKKGCAGPKGRGIDVRKEDDFTHFCTPGCRVEIVTPRLLLRPVHVSDDDRIAAIKMDPLVNSMQLYGQPSRLQVTRAFTQSYIENLIPALSSLGSSGTARERYVFAIEPRKEKDGSRAVQPHREPHALVDIDSEGYIGNIAIEITNPVKELTPRGGAPFMYPTVEALSASRTHAVLFYELHPNFWRQGLMSETIRALLPFIFQTLRLPHIIIDPLITNEGSILLAEKLGFVRIGETTGAGYWGKGGQALLRLTRGEWEKERGRKKAKAARKKSNKKAKESGATAGQEGSDELKVTVDGEDGVERLADKVVEPTEMAVQALMAQKGICRWCALAPFPTIPSRPVSRCLS
ncbi:hypothetical protein JCM3770_006487 [Rhodotorula araucariae]